MGETGETTTVCNHCDRDIPSPNIDLHRVHCARNLEKCKICGVMVPKKHAEEHFLTTHAPVPCSMCEETIEREVLDSHIRETCPKRTVTCEFCEFPLPAVDLAEHQVFHFNTALDLAEHLVVNNVGSSSRRNTRADGNGRSQRDGNGVSNKRVLFTVAVTGIAVLMGSLFFQRKGHK